MFPHGQSSFLDKYLSDSETDEHEPENKKEEEKQVERYINYIVILNFILKLFTRCEEIYF